MAKPKKLTVKIYEYRQIVEPEILKGSEVWPLYLVITFNRRTKTMKSPTYDFLASNGFGGYLILEDWEAIRKNDERLFLNIKKLVEGNGEEFSIDHISPQNQLFVNGKKPIYETFRLFFEVDLFKFFHEIQSKGQGVFINTIDLLSFSENLISFLFTIKELRIDLYESFSTRFPEWVEFSEQFTQLVEQNIFPFEADFRVNEQFLNWFDPMKFTKG